jgi:hypothetical protein
MQWRIQHPVRLAYQPPDSSNVLSEQTNHQQPASRTFLSEQISTSHRPKAKRRSQIVEGPGSMGFPTAGFAPGWMRIGSATFQCGSRSFFVRDTWKNIVSGSTSGLKLNLHDDQPGLQVWLKPLLPRSKKKAGKQGLTAFKFLFFPVFGPCSCYVVWEYELYLAQKRLKKCNWPKQTSIDSFFFCNQTCNAAD